ncbi:MAG: glycosyltransferase [Candidatus Methylomirabilales bacterium]
MQGIPFVSFVDFVVNNPDQGRRGVEGRVAERVALEGQAVARASGSVDVLVGIPALNQARSVGHVVERVAAGLAKQRDRGRAAIVVVDAGSRDRTPEAVPQTAEGGLRPQVVRLSQASRGRALLATLAGARQASVRACAIVDAGLESVSPEGLERLLTPVLAGEADYVSPTYSHPASEGTLTTNLLAPMARALFGKRLRQVVGHCLALSPAMAARAFSSMDGETEVAERAVEVWLPLEAMASGSRVVEADQGRKVMDPGLTPPDLATTLVQVLGPFFGLLGRYRGVWMEGAGHSLPLPHRGAAPALLPPAAGVQVERMIKAFRLGLKDLAPLWEEILPEETLQQLYPLGLLAADEFRFPPDTWAEAVYAFAGAYHERRLPRDHLIRSLTPLYLGRTAAFLLEARETTPERLGELLEQVSCAFEAAAEHLRARWR